MLTFDHDEARWSWDLDRIHAKGYTDNVVDLMVGKLNRLPAADPEGIAAAGLPRKQSPRSRHFASFSETPEEEVHADLWEAVRQELSSQSGERL